jgi:hypothetical protein
MKLLAFVDGRIIRDQCCLMFTAAVSVEEGVSFAVTSLPIRYSRLTDIDQVCHDSCTRSHDGHSYPTRTRVEGSPSFLADGSSMIMYLTMSIRVFHLDEVDRVRMVS